VLWYLLSSPQALYTQASRDRPRSWGVVSKVTNRKHTSWGWSPYRDILSACDYQHWRCCEGKNAQAFGRHWERREQGVDQMCAASPVCVRLQLLAAARNDRYYLLTGSPLPSMIVSRKGHFGCMSDAQCERQAARRWLAMATWGKRLS